MIGADRGREPRRTHRRKADAGDCAAHARAADYDAPATALKTDLPALKRIFDAVSAGRDLSFDRALSLGVSSILVREWRFEIRMLRRRASAGYVQWWQSP